MTVDWNDILFAYLHDPPDKALDIKGHVERARQYIAVALAANAPNKLGGAADQQAARAERLPAPHWEHAKVDANDSLTTFHPLSGQPHPLTVKSCDPAWVSRHINDIVTRAGDDTEKRVLALWRVLPEKLSAEHPEYALLPADTRIPDHTIWHHLDITAGLQAAQVDSNTGAAFLSFSLGPVQSFISAARTVRDLWSGSMILSYLTFQAMLPIIEEYGPTAMIYPALRSAPLLDLWLRRVKKLSAELVPEPKPAHKLAPCLPNRFLAVVPYGAEGTVAKKLADDCREAASKAWQKIAISVRNKLDSYLSRLSQEWAGLWPAQIVSFFEFRTSVMPWQAFRGSDKEVAKLWKLWKNDNSTFEQAFPDPEKVRALHDAIPHEQKPGFRRSDGSWQPYQRPLVGDWQAKVDLSARLMEAQKSIRHFPDYRPGAEDVPGKCSMLGTFEQMGPANLTQSGAFWKKAGEVVGIDGVHLRERERLCAVALVKRFSGPCFFRDELELHQHDLRYDDTATLAAAEWLQHAGIDHEQIRKEHDSWSGQWLHWSRKDVDEDAPCPSPVWRKIQDAKRRVPESPPIYYAVLMLDGDNLGGWLRGANSPSVEQVMHPKLVAYFRNLPNQQKVSAGLKARRSVGPAMHAAISSALANFALHVVPKTVEQQHNGTLIYSGGDDTLALLPTRQGLACAYSLEKAYRSDYYSENGSSWLMMGSKATLSGGLAIVHYKEDLRAALDVARDAEKQAKKLGRNALVITACRRSGERASALCPWNFVDEMTRFVEGFCNQASDRWAYHLKADLATLQGLPVGAMRAEIRRQVGRAEKETRETFPPEGIVASFEQFRVAKKDQGESRFRDDGEALAHFLTLIQSASFLARGRDT